MRYRCAAGAQAREAHSPEGHCSFRAAFRRPACGDILSPFPSLTCRSSVGDRILGANHGEFHAPLTSKATQTPTYLEKSLKVADEMLAAHGLVESIHLEEGSGISRNNRFTARGLAKVLDLFAPYADLLYGHDSV
jgi:D-Ala-D-Ala carboxypeptidase 3 (S13) family